jgi:hypothetical protein
MMLESIYRHPMKEDLIVLYNLVHDNEFAEKDISGKLETNIRRLTERKIIIKIRRVGKGHWIYKINPSYYFYLKRGEIPSIGKV